jgi:hypothetical protein
MFLSSSGSQQPHSHSFLGKVIHYLLFLTVVIHYYHSFSYTILLPFEHTFDILH